MKVFQECVAAVVLSFVLIAGGGGCASEPKQESSGEYLDDAVITTKVKAAIFNEPSLKASEIKVVTYKGAVQLSGFVGSAAARDKAVEGAKTVKGVKSVSNDMQLK